MEVKTCQRRQILKPCSLEGFAFQIDPYIGCEHHCYYCYALNQAETDWTQTILIYPDIAQQLETELATVRPQPMYMGWNTDPYQPAEAIHRQTQQVLALLARKRYSVCILTKSNLVTRDIDLISRMPGSSVGFSISFEEEEVRQLFEPRAPSNNARIAALKALKAAGIETYVLITPVLPFITNVDAIIERVAPHTDRIWIYRLSIEEENNANWQNLQRVLNEHFPQLVEPYRQIAFTSEHAYWRDLHQHLEHLQSAHHVDLRIHV